MKKFKEEYKNNLKLLELYVPVVERVHGESHPEFYQVAKVYKKLNVKLELESQDLSQEFTDLREITSNYEVPSDTCETYEAVYNMLAEMDKSYQG